MATSFWRRNQTWLQLALLAAILLIAFSAVEGAKGSSSSQGGSVNTEALKTAAAARSRKRALRTKRESKRASKRAEREKSAQRKNSERAKKRKERQARWKKEDRLERRRKDEIVSKKKRADTPEVRRKGEEKLKWLLRESSKSSNRIISMDTATYNQFVHEGPRPYWLFVSYTALTSQSNCYYCFVAYEAYQPVAVRHYDRNVHQVEKMLSSQSIGSFPSEELPVFFVHLDAAKNPQFFKENSLSNAPIMLLAPPRLSTNVLKASQFFNKLHPKYRFTLQARMEPNDFLSFINKLVQIHLHIEPKIDTLNLVFMATILIGGAVALVKYYEFLLRLREIKALKHPIVVGSWLLYCWCIAGGMYNIIRGTEFAHYDKESKTWTYINGDSRDQFAAEGLIVGGMNLGVAFMMVLFNTGAFETVDPNAKADKTPKKLNPIQHLKNAIAPLFTVSVCAACAFAFWFQVLNIYSRKNWGYRMGFVWRD